MSIWESVQEAERQSIKAKRKNMIGPVLLFRSLLLETLKDASSQTSSRV